MLNCTPRIADISARGANEYLVIEVVCEDADGHHAVTSQATIVLLGSAPATAADAAASVDQEVAS